MQLSDLTLRQAVIEVRHDPAYLLWDRAGQLWSTVNSHYDSLRMITADPNQTVFRLGENTEFAARLEGASLNAILPKRTLLEFADHAKFFFPAHSNILEIEEYSRVGLRLVFSKEYQTYRDASDALLEGGVLRHAENDHFGLSGKPLRPEWALRWEDAGSGVHIRANVDEKKYDFQAPLEWEGPKPEKKPRIKLTYDVDWYKVSPTLVTQMSFPDWIEQCLHLTNRESDHFLEDTK